MIGSFARDSMNTNTAPSRSPVPIRPPTSGVAQSAVCLFVSPMSRVLMATVNTAAPR